MLKVTCRYCKNKIDKKDAFLEEYLNDNLEIKNRYYCNKECFDKKNEEIVRKQWLKRVKKENREKIRTICGLKEKEKNIYFQSTYKSITDNFSQEDIYEFINKYEKDMLVVLNSKDFKTVNSRVKYCLLMLENQLQHYVAENQLERYQLDKQESKEKTEEVKEVEPSFVDEDFDIVVNVEKRERRGIDDILGL